MQMSEEKYDVVNVVDVFGNKKAFRLDSIKELYYSPNYNDDTIDYCVELGTDNKDENSVYVTPDDYKAIEKELDKADKMMWSHTTVRYRKRY